MPGKPSMEKSSDGGSPLIKFRGILKEYELIETTYQDSGRKSERVKFDFTDVQVIESREPYSFPIATIQIGYNNQSDSRWDVWKESAAKFLPTRDIDLLQGKEQEWYYGPAKVRGPLKNEDGEDVIDERTGKAKWGLMDADAWQVTWVEGAEVADGASITDRVLELLDGKTESAFNAALMTDQEARRFPQYMDTVSAMTDRKLIPGLVTAGLVKQNTDGTYSKA